MDRRCDLVKSVDDIDKFVRSSSQMLVRTSTVAVFVWWRAPFAHHKLVTKHVRMQGLDIAHTVCDKNEHTFG